MAQLAEKHGLKLRANCTAQRGWFITLAEKDVPGDTEILPAVFVQVSRLRKTLIMTTNDLRKLNDRLHESSMDMNLRSNAYGPTRI